jgi:hypothetical protein
VEVLMVQVHALRTVQQVQLVQLATAATVTAAQELQAASAVTYLAAPVLMEHLHVKPQIAALTTTVRSR